MQVVGSDGILQYHIIDIGVIIDSNMGGERKLIVNALNKCAI